MPKISDKKLQEKIEYEPFPAQQEIINSKAREKVICCGRRFGKTTVSAYLLLKELLKPNKKIWIVAPSYDLTKYAFDNVLQWLVKLFPQESKMYKIAYKPYPTIETSWGSKLEGKSTENPVGLLGAELDMILIDEAAQVSEEVFNSYIYPTTHDRQGSLIFISTPKGRNWFFERWQKAKEFGGAFHYTSLDRPSFPKEEWEEAKKNTPSDVFAEMYEAKFMDAASQVFKDAWIEQCKGAKMRDAEEGHRYSIGIDFAKMNDFFVAVVVDELNNDVVHVEREKAESFPYQKERIRALAAQYNNAKVLIDSTGMGDPIFDDLYYEEKVMVEDFNFSNSSKHRLINKLRIYLEQNKVTLPNYQPMLEELQLYAQEMTPSGNIRYNAPKGMHDDTVIALALAIWDLDTSAPQKKTALERERQRARQAYTRKKMSSRFNANV